MSRFTESNNPFMKEDAYEKSITPIDTNSTILHQESMTVNGAIDKSFMLLGLMMVTAYYSWIYGGMGMLITGAIGGLVVVLIASFKREYSGTLAPIYALLEGLFIGTISKMYAGAFDGIVVQAILLTSGMLGLMLLIYKFRIIEVTQKFKTGVMMATGGVLLLYLTSFILGFFGINIPYLHENGLIGIGISLVIIVIASLNLLLDFDNIEKGAAIGAPKYMEWFSAMGLIITLVWLYIEFLRLLSILNRD